MTRLGRAVRLLGLVALLISVFAVSAVATDEGGEGGDGVAPPSTVESGLSPAVSIDNSEPAAAQLDWTYRYMIPIGLVLAAVIVIMTSIKYFTDVVRRRYRIVDQ